MAKRKIILDDALMEPSEDALKFWGKEVEDALPKPVITEDVSQLTPSLFLQDMLRYARGAESRGEWLFRHNYLHPLFDHYSTINSVTTTWEQDDMGNMYIQVGEVNGVMHVGHVDTVHADDCSPIQDISLSKEGIISLDPILKNSFPVLKEGTRWVEGVDVKHHYPAYELPPKKTRSLGADDACALAIMIYLIAHEVQGTYIFTRGEEIGCVGTHYIIDNDLVDWSQYMMAIEVDRKGTNEIIGNMSVGITASQSFVSSLAEQLNMNHVMGKGTITDVGHISKYVPECVNISAGYNLQHSERETTDINYLDRLGVAMLAVNWDELVVERRAGAFHAPVVHKPYVAPAYNRNNWNSGNTYKPATRNSYGDFSEEPDSVETKFDDMFTATNAMFMQEAYVRSNTGFIVEFLVALNISPKEMHNIICFGSVEGEIDLSEIDLSDVEAT